MKYIIVICICFLFQLNKSIAADPTICLNPGVKLGYQFGENGGFVYGFEVSLTNTFIQRFNSQLVPGTYLSYGILFNIDYCKNNTKIHCGVQFSSLPLGFDIGPTFYIKDNKSSSGYSVCLFSFIGVLPYYEYTRIFDEQNTSFSQTGVFMKLPLPLSLGSSFDVVH